LQIDAWLRLNDINMELANALESLAPFGAGNPPLVLASHTVQLKSVTTIGRAQEHLRLAIEDESGNMQSILWWGGAGEELPEIGSKINLAYSLRAGTFRGKRQVTLQFIDMQVVEDKAIELKPATVEVEDWRTEPGRLKDLKENVLVWAEGVDKAKGKNRLELYPAEEFAIYTAPPSPAELRAALESVKPKKVYLFGVPPAQQNASSQLKMTDEFLSLLAGLAKFVINQREGKVSVQDLASATSQRVSVIRIGLEWLTAGGHVSIVGDRLSDSLILSAGNGETNQYLQKELYVAVKGILEETAAYRAHFKKADMQNLMGLASK
jgi:single-stranded-DNA-specific exonuclease